MLGYLLASEPGVIQPPAEGWHDTGDIVVIDEEGFARIAGRAKRFAKIAGEMVSLGQVETEISALWPDHMHAVVAIPDERKGEQLVLITDNPAAARDAVAAHFRSRGLAELMLQRTILVVDKLPVLGTGKIDYPAVSKLVAEREAAHA
jgi:acyl-[acyl-carrier-protein]-phospholipid O-acyltransferase/long-chain-fatty-acid--[acyl-carrier-protein] ligase